jgi:hypothetical protein
VSVVVQIKFNSIHLLKVSCVDLAGLRLGRYTTKYTLLASTEIRSVWNISKIMECLQRHGGRQNVFV